jgi:hypothetical protein
MKTSSAIAVALLVATSNIYMAAPSAAGEDVAKAAATPAKEDRAIDCSKEVWPNFSPSCLRNANESTGVRLVKVRLVTANRL